MAHTIARHTDTVHAYNSMIVFQHTLATYCINSNSDINTYAVCITQLCYIVSYSVLASLLVSGAQDGYNSLEGAFYALVVKNALGLLK